MVEYELCLLIQEFYVYDVLKKFLDYCTERGEKVIEVKRGKERVRYPTDKFDVILESVDKSIREEGEEAVEVRPDKMPCTLVFTFDGFVKLLGITRNIKELEHRFKDFNFYTVTNRDLFDESGVVLAKEAKQRSP